jgi:hypothetical protein
MKINSIGINNNYNRTINKANPSFSSNGIKDRVVKGLTGFYEGVAKKEGMQKFLHNFSKSDKTFTLLLVAESAFLSSFYMINTLRNKKIKKEQKPQMLINDALTWGVSTAGACLLEGKIGNLVNNGAEKYFANHSDFYTQLGQKAQETLTSTPTSELLGKVGEAASKTGEELSKGIKDVTSMIGQHLKGIVNTGNKFKAFNITPEKLQQVQTSVSEAVTSNAGNAAAAKDKVKEIVSDVYTSSAARAQADKVLPGINKLKTLVIFGIIYRYLGPVVITPIANKLSSKLMAKNNKTEEKK